MKSIIIVVCFVFAVLSAGVTAAGITDKGPAEITLDGGSKGMVDFPLVTTGSVKITPIVYPYHLTFVPRLFRDGNMWCALYGENIMEGIVGFGKTPNEAINSFNNAFYEEIVDNEVRI